MVVLEWGGFASIQREDVRVLLRQTPAYGANGANLIGDAQCADYRIPGNREEVYVFINLVEAFYQTLESELRGHRPIVRITVFQTENVGAIPSARSKHKDDDTDTSRFSGEDRRLQPGARGFNSLSALYSNGSRRDGYPGLSDMELALRSIRR